MTKGTKAFRIIICILLALTMIWSVLIALVIDKYIEDNDNAVEEYGIFVAGIPVTSENKDDILGDGTVFYDVYNNTLVLANATVEFDYTAIYSTSDLTIELIGDNKVISTNEVYCVGIHAADNNLAKNLTIGGEGSLTVEFPNSSKDSAGIFASELTIMSDVTVITPDCENSINGIICTSSLLIANNATVTVNNGAANYSSAVRVRGNAFLETGTALNVSVAPGTSGMCKGLSVSGILFIGDNTALDVAIDDGATDLGECIRVSGLMDIGSGATVKASAKNTNAIECFGTIEANEGAIISAVSENNDADLFCSGTVVDRGAEISGNVDALGGIHNRS